jgi:hypothetical protein
LLFRRLLTLALYPKMALPDFMTSFSREFMESCVFFCGWEKKEKSD